MKSNNIRCHKVETPDKEHIKQALKAAKKVKKTEISRSQRWGGYNI